jgi:TP901-1 family phage major tail protein
MSGQKGRDVLIKIGDGDDPEAFVTVAGIRAKTISLNARTVDGTSGESPQAWRELIAGAGVKSASVSGAGVFKDAASDALIQQAFFAQAAVNFQLIIPDFGALTGSFMIEALDYSGDHDGEAAFAITLASAGALSFAVL